MYLLRTAIFFMVAFFFLFLHFSFITQPRSWGTGRPSGWDKMKMSSQKEIEKEEEWKKNRILTHSASAIKDIFEKLKTNPTSIALQAEYLKHFPKNQKDFNTMFGFNMEGGVAGELYESESGNDYIWILTKFNKRYIPYICKISLNIAKDSSPFEVDRYGELKCMMEALLFKHTETFREKLFLLPLQERTSAMQFIIYYVYYSNEFPEFIRKLHAREDREFIAVISDAIKLYIRSHEGCSCLSLPSSATNYIIDVNSITSKGCRNDDAELKR